MYLGAKKQFQRKDPNRIDKDPESAQGILKEITFLWRDCNIRKN